MRSRLCRSQFRVVNRNYKISWLEIGCVDGHGSVLCETVLFEEGHTIRFNRRVGEVVDGDRVVCVRMTLAEWSRY